MGNFQDLTGQRFGRLKVLEQGETLVSQSGKRRIRWVCKCKCGVIKLVVGESVRSGATTSCGCRKRETGRENAIKRRGTHVKDMRDTETPEYSVWCGMRIAVLRLKRPAVRQLVVADEPLKHLSKDLVPLARELIVKLAKDLGIQFIITTHNEALECGRVIRMGEAD